MGVWEDIMVGRELEGSKGVGGKNSGGGGGLWEKEVRVEWVDMRL